MGKKIRTLDKKQIVLPADLKPDYRNQLVRIGSKYDGGYVLAASLLGQIEEIITYGLGFNWDFETEIMMLNPRIKIDCYDHSVNLSLFRKEYIISILKYFNKTEKRTSRIAAYNSYMEYFQTKKINHYELMVGSIDGKNKISVPGTIERLHSSGNKIFLKCDIEGGEYEIMEPIFDNINRFIGIAIEFHNVGDRFDEFRALVGRFRKDFYLDHIHANNLSEYNAENIPSVLEVSFSRKGIPKSGDPGIGSMNGLWLSWNGNDLDTPNDARFPDTIIHYQ